MLRNLDGWHTGLQSVITTVFLRKMQKINKTDGHGTRTTQLSVYKLLTNQLTTVVAAAAAARVQSGH